MLTLPSAPLAAASASAGEDIIAERVLKRAEISRITRQLKTRLAKAGIKAKVESSQLYSSSPVKHSSPSRFTPSVEAAHRSPTVKGVAPFAHRSPTASGAAPFSHFSPTAKSAAPFSHLSPTARSAAPFSQLSPRKLSHPSSAATEIEYPAEHPHLAPQLAKRALDSDATDTDTEYSPMKKHTTNPTLGNIPSSPIYHTQRAAGRGAGAGVDPPQTPPPTYSSLARSLASQSARLQLSPARPFMTPRAHQRTAHPDEEGADLLMFLATSPSPATYGKNSLMLGGLPCLPKLQLDGALATLNMTASAAGVATISSTKPKPLFVAPATPKRGLPSGLLAGLLAKTPILARFGAGADLLKTPTTMRATPAGFSMSDYVNFLTPSPISRAMSGRTPHQGTADLSAFHLSSGLQLGGSNLGPGAAGRIVNFDKLSFGGEK